MPDGKSPHTYLHLNFRAKIIHIKTVRLYSEMYFSFSLSLIISQITLIIHSPESLLSAIVDLSQVLTLLKVLKDLSTVHVVTGSVKAIKMALDIAGKYSASFSKSNIPSVILNWQFKLLFDHMSYQVFDSASKLSMLYSSIMF